MIDPLILLTALVKDLQLQVMALNTRLDEKSVKPNNKDIVKIQEAADFLGLSKSRVYSLCSQNLIPHIKKGGLYFSIIGLTNWINGGRVLSVLDHRANADKLLNGIPFKKQSV